MIIQHERRAYAFPDFFLVLVGVGKAQRLTTGRQRPQCEMQS